MVSLRWAFMILSMFCCFSGSECNVLGKLPEFGEIYHVTGTIYLPYAEIEEPFEAWYNLTARKSRIQYYHGQVITYQVGTERPWGAYYKVTPETTEIETNVLKCFRLNGSAVNLVKPQSVFPSMDGFRLVRREYYKGHLCDMWQNVSYWGTKKNVYSLWVTASEDHPVPVHYEMRGYNNLLGSHYDKYEIDYAGLSHNFSASILDLPKDMDCEWPPGQGEEHLILANPMQDYIEREEDRGHRLFHQYRKKFGKRYGSQEELEQRSHTFIHNMRFVHSKNRARLSYKLALNHLADHTPEEMASLRGLLQDQTPNVGEPFPGAPYSHLLLPESFDWRLYGAVTPVKDQAICGSCWSFATTGVLEGALFLKTGVLTSLSQQALMDCSWGFGNYGCDGGLAWRALEWVKKHGGIPSAESYAPYRGQNGFCHYNQSEFLANVSRYIRVPYGNITALKAAVFKNGPVAVSIDAAPRSFAFYANGVYYEPECSNDSGNLNHAVLVVGYGVLQGETYWLIKNSWSTHWGNDGYILLSMKDNICGVANAGIFPILA
ncbi:digestive cysteine proteinase 1-like [Eublepharis macularius]|uniref:Digestive cysteine proteinase 1-like n=1 Tax=Eublepharis macularius TaxID=481883 RepID=A0AA97LH36_EUBMA|nr:digestive cysteine proteinase 1-like [Eublepharis macularius]